MIYSQTLLVRSAGDLDLNFEILIVQAIESAISVSYPMLRMELQNICRLFMNQDFVNKK